MAIEVFVDGACEPVNPGGIATYGFVIYRDGERVESGSGVAEREDTSNNVAEYTAVVQALMRLLERGTKGEQIVIRSDSELLVNQLSGLYEVRAPRVVFLYAEAKSLMAELESRGNELQFLWIPRELNEEADALTRQAYEEFCTENSSTLAQYSEHLATKKQREFMARLGIPVPPGCSKRTASRLIEERLEGR
jgi:ribonuclease HI